MEKRELQEGALVMLRNGTRGYYIGSDLIASRMGNEIASINLKFYDGDLKYFHRDEDDKDIIMVSTPTGYVDVVRRNGCLCEAERTELKKALWFIDGEVKSIAKKTDYDGTQYITIAYIPAYIDSNVYRAFFHLPCFEKDTKFKGMDDGREYTLEELGL